MCLKDLKESIFTCGQIKPMLASRQNIRTMIKSWVHVRIDGHKSKVPFDRVRTDGHESKVGFTSGQTDTNQKLSFKSEQTDTNQNFHSIASGHGHESKVGFTSGQTDTNQKLASHQDRWRLIKSPIRSRQNRRTRIKSWTQVRRDGHLSKFGLTAGQTDINQKLASR